MAFAMQSCTTLKRGMNVSMKTGFGAVAICVLAAALALPLVTNASGQTPEPLPTSAETDRTIFINPALRDSGERAAKPESFRFLTVDGFAPFSAFDESGTLRGIHVDLARLLCIEMGIEDDCTIRAIPFDEVEATLTAGQADAALAGIVPTRLNRDSLAFTEAYARLPARLATNPMAMQSGKAAIGFVVASVHAELAKLLFDGSDLKPFATSEAMQAALKDGSIGRAFGEGIALGFFVSSAGAANCCQMLNGSYFLPAVKPDAMRIAVAATRADTVVALDQALRSIQTSGALNEILLRHIPFGLVD
jgi:polar amino acid transport system substrate-binding protein